MTYAIIALIIGGLVMAAVWMNRDRLKTAVQAIEAANTVGKQQGAEERQAKVDAAVTAEQERVKEADKRAWETASTASDDELFDMASKKVERKKK